MLETTALPTEPQHLPNIISLFLPLNVTSTLDGSNKLIELQKYLGTINFGSPRLIRTFFKIKIWLARRKEKSLPLINSFLNNTTRSRRRKEYIILWRERERQWLCVTWPWRLYGSFSMEIPIFLIESSWIHSKMSNAFRWNIIGKILREFLISYLLFEPKVVVTFCSPWWHQLHRKVKVEQVGTCYSCLHAWCGLLKAAEAAPWHRWMKNPASPAWRHWMNASKQE